MNFHDHTLLYEYLKREYPDIAKQGAETFYREKMVELRQTYRINRNRHCITAYNQSHAEMTWHKLGRPYFKIFPNLLPMFMNTKLAVPGKYLHSPFSNFLIRLPENHGCEELTVDGNELKTALITEASGEETLQLDRPVDHSHMFIIWMNFGEKYQGIPYYIYQVMKFKDDETIEEAIARQRTPEMTDDETLAFGLDIGNDKINNCMRLVVATCFLSTGADRIVEPDVLNKDLLRYIEAKRNENSERIQRLHDKAQRRGKHGWTLGREIVMPSHFQSSEEGEATGHLSHQHQRGAHFHVYHYGIGRNKWKVKWINQLTVRPDLPLPAVQTKRGYKAE